MNCHRERQIFSTAASQLCSCQQSALQIWKLPTDALGFSSSSSTTRSLPELLGAISPPTPPLLALFFIAATLCSRRDECFHFNCCLGRKKNPSKPSCRSRNTTASRKLFSFAFGRRRKPSEGREVKSGASEELGLVGFVWKAAPRFIDGLIKRNDSRLWLERWV